MLKYISSIFVLSYCKNHSGEKKNTGFYEENKHGFKFYKHCFFPPIRGKWKNKKSVGFMLPEHVFRRIRYTFLDQQQNIFHISRWKYNLGFLFASSSASLLVLGLFFIYVYVVFRWLCLCKIFCKYVVSWPGLVSAWTTADLNLLLSVNCLFLRGLSLSKKRKKINMENVYVLKNCPILALTFEHVRTLFHRIYPYRIFI